jgi:hypothetical protein
MSACARAQTEETELKRYCTGETRGVKAPRGDGKDGGKKPRFHAPDGETRRRAINVSRD